MAELPASMKAVVFNGPHNVSVEERPVPKLQNDGDIIVKVQSTALCGSEMHLFRGIEPSGTGYIMGHEFTGVVVETGSAIKNVAKGDKIVCPFTVSCGDCFFCKHGASSRCVDSQPFGSERLDGAQAEYVRVPLADSSVMKAPPTISDKALVLMADIFPTGFFGVKSAVQMCSTADVSESTIVVIGCGPVGLCAVVSALHLKPRRVFAVDSIDSRLELARKLGAEPLNFKTDPEGMKARVMEATEGRGADMVVEVVGLSAALRTAYDLIRPFGAISSIGVHNAEIPWTGTDGYNKNVRLQMGRCPVRSVFPEALAVLEKTQDKFE
jgi:threonine dehydrogenase-like Zn-dependent dehydrogenase